MSRISALSPLILFLCLNILSLAAAASLPCPRRGSERPPLPAVFGAPFVCARFWSAGAGIRLPNDTLSVKYGMLNTGGPTFNARGGRAFNISAELPQLTPEQSAATQQTLFKATLGAGMVIKLEAVVFVENAAMLWPFRGLRFAGNAEMLGPPTGIPAKDYLLLDFETTVRNSSTRSGLGVGELRGKFVNRNKAARYGAGACRPAFVSSPAEALYYPNFMGTTTNVKLTWFPAMHSPGDTELVVSFSDVGGGYMGRAPSLLDLMTDHVRPMSKLWSFSIHGNPVGAVYLVRGRFGGANCTLC